jgi:hypothetical protein
MRTIVSTCGLEQPVPGYNPGDYMSQRMAKDLKINIGPKVGWLDWTYLSTS